MLRRYGLLAFSLAATTMRDLPALDLALAGHQLSKSESRLVLEKFTNVLSKLQSQAPGGPAVASSMQISVRDAANRFRRT